MWLCRGSLVVLVLRSLRREREAVGHCCSSLICSSHFVPTGAGGGAGGQAEGAQERGPAPAAQEPGAGGAQDQPPPGALHLQVSLGLTPKGGSAQRGAGRREGKSPQWGHTAGGQHRISLLVPSAAAQPLFPKEFQRNSSSFSQQQRGICWELLQRSGVASQEAGVAT